MGGRIRRGIGAERDAHALLQDQRKAECCHDRQGGDAVDGLNDDALDQRAEDESDQRGNDKPEPEISGRLQREPRQDGSDHEEVAVRNVDDVKQTENDRKTERDQRNDQAPDQAVQREQ